MAFFPRFVLIFAVLTAAGFSSARADVSRERISLDQGWRFAKGDPAGTGDRLAYARIKDWILPAQNEFLASGEVPRARPEGDFPFAPPYAAAAFDDRAWRTLDLPHDWGIEGPFDPKGSGATARLPFWGVGWYRRHLALPVSDRGRSLFLQIDGAMSYATVWFNGRLIGGWPYGYASWEVDLTRYALPGQDNVLAIRLDNPPDSSRWYPGGGIYRNVWLVKTSAVHVAHWGTYVSTPQVSADEATVVLRVAVQDDRSAPRPAGPVTVRTDIYALDGRGERAGVPVASSPATGLALPAVGGAKAEATQRIRIEHPLRWSTEAPHRYVAVTTIEENGVVMDVYDTPFGIRTIEFDPNRGFLLNGAPLRLQGVCDHHDLGALGAAINVRALERQLEELRQMGCNAIRTSHNPPAPELLDLCDRMGFVVMDEAFDCWEEGKRPANDYHLLFPDWHEADLRAQIERDRNHPSVVMWSIGNEIREQHEPALGVKIGGELQRIVHEEDPTRPVTSACNYGGSANNGFENIVDVFGSNYGWQRYAAFRRMHPDKFLFGSETASCVSSRGVYVFPVSDDKAQGLDRADSQVSSYDLSAPKWAWPPDAEFRAEDETPGVGGEFVWTGWDYLGEPEPYGRRGDVARSSYFGIIDLAGFRKDRFYLYQSHWRPDFPMAHLLPHWTWPERVGQVTPVHVYTSGDEAELFLNGHSLGRKKKARGEYRLRWDDVVYEPGELKVVAYKDGKPWAEDTERTAGAPAALVARVDRAMVRADGRDLAFVTVAVVDRAGVPCPAGDRIRFSVSGPGQVAATDNGDPTDLESFQSSARRAFNGLVLAIVRPQADAPGPITVTAEADGLRSSSVEIRSTAE